MEETLLYPSLTLFFLLLAIRFYTKSRKQHKNLPPSPPSLPIIGHLHLLKQPIHQTFHNISQKYGPIMSLRFGSRLVVIISSPSAVEECFTKNDIILANRPHLTLGKFLEFNFTTLVTAPYGDHWRNLRRICAVEILSNNRLNNFSTIRKDEIKILLKNLYQVSSQGFARVKLRPMFSELTFNTVLRMIIGKRSCNEGKEFREIIQECFKSADASYPGDFLPILKWVDYNGFVKKVKLLRKRINVILQGFIDEHTNDCVDRNTMIGHLLSLQETQPEYYTDEIIKGLIMNLILAGTDTTAVTLEWAMANLLNNPQVLKKAKNELEIQIGNKLIEDSDLFRLPFLRNIISENQRLNPAAPLLLPHYSSNDCIIGEYDIPKDTIVLVNAWAMHRDPEIWDDALKFKPERFENGENDQAICYRFIPFGVGRRACPGMGLANRVVGVALGSLIQCFDWKRINNDIDVDMAEGNGLTAPKAEPLEAMCKVRCDMSKVLSSLERDGSFE